MLLSLKTWAARSSETSILMVGDVLELQVISIDTTDAGLLRIRVAAPAGSDVAVSSENLTVAVAGESSKALVVPVESESLSVSLVIDTSQSMSGEAMAAAKEAGAVFVRSLPVDAELSIIEFGSQALVVIGPSTDRDGARTAIESLEASGETSLYDGVITSVGSLGSADRKAIVVLSDGGDTASAANLDEAISAIQSAQVEVVAVALATDESNNEPLEELAGAGDGVVVSTNDPKALEEIYLGLASDLSSEYEIQIPVDLSGRATVSLQLVDQETETTYAWSDSVAISAPETLAFTGVEQPPPNVVQIPPPSFAGQQMVWVGAGCFFVAVAMVGVAVATWSPARATATPRVNYARPGSNISVLRDLRSSATLVVEGAITDSGTKAGTSARLEHAGVTMRTGEFVLLSLGLLLIMAFLGAIFFGYVGGAIGGMLGFAAPRFGVRFLMKRRRKKFAKQLPDLLSAFSNTLKVGYSLPQAIAAVANEAEEPAQSELKRALLEARVGGSMVSSLSGVAERVGSEDLGWVVDAIEINSTVGGDLAEVLERVAETIRARTRLKAQVASLTAEARMSAGVLFFLPPGLGLLILFINPEYFEGVLDVTAGYLMLGLAAFLLLAGGTWLKKMIGSVSP